jgi:hypothetical protein
MQWLSAPGIYMEDLFVSPSFRSLGVGSALLSYLGRHARAIGATRIDWAVLRWNVGARTFYRETCGGEELEEWLGVRVEGAEAIAKLIALNEGEVILFLSCAISCLRMDMKDLILLAWCCGEGSTVEDGASRCSHSCPDLETLFYLCCQRSLDYAWTPRRPNFVCMRPPLVK